MAAGAADKVGQMMDRAQGRPALRRAAQSSSARRWGLVVLALALLAGIGLSVGARHEIRQRRATAIARAEDAARQQANVLRALWRQKWDDIQVLHDTAAQLSEAIQAGDTAAAAAIRQRLAELLRISRAADFAEVGAVAADGAVLWTTNAGTPQRPALDPAAFDDFAASARQSYIGALRMDAATGYRVTPFVRAVRDPQARLRYATVVALRSDSAQRFLEMLTLGQQDVFAIWRDDGTVISSSRTSGLKPALRNRFAGDCPMPSIAVTHGASNRDGLRRVYAAACVPGTQTMVTVGLDEAVWLNVAEAAATTIARIAGVAGLLLVLAAGFAVRSVAQSFENRRRRQNERALLADLAAFHDLADRIGEMFVKSAGPDLRIEYISPGSIQLLGRQPDAMIGHSVRDYVHPDDLPIMNGRAERLAIGAPLDRTEYRVVYADGVAKWVSAESTAVQQAGETTYYAAIRDVTAQRAARVALEQAKDEIDAILAAGPGVISRIEIQTDGSRRLTYISPTVEHLAGFTQAEALAPDGVLARLPPDIFARLDAALAESRDPGRATLELQGPHKDGVPRWRRAYVRRSDLPDGRKEEIWYVVDSTDLHVAETARLAAERRVSELVERSPAGLFQYVLHADGTDERRYDSPNMAEIYGYPLEFFAQPGAWESCVDQATRDRWRVLRQQVIETGYVQWEYPIRCGNGQIKHMLSSARAEPLGGGAWQLTGTLIDVTAQRAAEQALAQARLDLESAVNAGPGALLRVRLSPDAGPQVEFASAAVERLTGHSPQEATQPGWLNRIADPQNLEAMRMFQSSGLAFAPCVVELRVQTRCEAQRWVQFSVQPQQRTAAGGVIVVAYAMDITEQKEQYARLVHTAKLATLGEMATSMAHELNQPLATMSMAAENAVRELKEAGNIEGALRRLGRIHEQAMRAAKLIDHLRVFGRSDESGVTAVAVPEVVEGALLLASAKLRAQAIDIVEAYQDGLPAVRGNKVLLEQVILNILSNACDAYEAGGRRSADQPRLVWISGRLVDGRVVVTVADQAGGIPEAILPRMFEPFFTTKTATKGTGVGLSFCYGVIVDMGGTLRAYNENNGAVFEIALPAMTTTDGAAISVGQR